MKPLSTFREAWPRMRRVGTRPIVVTSPHYNAYTAGNIDVSLLFRELELIPGLQVKPFSLKALAKGAYDIVHVHWPEWLLTRSAGAAALHSSSRATLAALTKAQTSGTIILWDANNTKPHEPDKTGATDSFLKTFSEMCDVLVASNGALENEFIAEYPALMSAQRVHLGNINYTGAYACESITKTHARRALGLPERKRTALAFGAVRRYKNLPSIMETYLQFSRSETETVHLVIAGGASDNLLCTELNRIASAAPERFTLTLESVPDSLVASYFRAADFTLIGTSQAVKSSVAAVSLSLGTPVWMPNRGAAIDYADEIAPPMLNLYAGGLTRHIMELAFSATTVDEQYPPAALVNGRLGMPWNEYAKAMYHLYSSCHAKAVTQ